MKKVILLFLYWILKSESKIILKRFKPQIIAITGSIAKSSTKEAVFNVLKMKFSDQVGKSYGNLNNELGIPLSILAFKFTPRAWQWPYIILNGFFRAILISNYPKILVLELAADKPGDIDYLLSFIKPKIGIVTAIGPTHLEAFKNIENVYQEKVKLIKYLPENGAAILNQDDLRVKKMKDQTRARVIFYQGAGLNIAQKAAQKIGQLYDVKPDQIEKAIKSTHPLKGRLNLINGIKGSKIINDTYNSNPLSCSLALDYLSTFKNQRKVAILGDMLELGAYSPEAHLEIGEKATNIADLLILVGENFKTFKKADKWYPNSILAAKEIQNYIKNNDIVLIKGSRGIKMEKVVDKLISRPGLK